MVRAACYITGGDSECGDMVAFFRRINRGIEYFQRCPNKPKYRKRSERIYAPAGNAVQQNLRGLTGSDLISYAVEDIRTHYAEQSRPYDFDMIVIEDDADFRFGNDNPQSKLRQYEATIRSALVQVPNTNSYIPIHFIFASPELEIWFLADWEHSFQECYCKKFGYETGRFYTTRLYSYIRQNLLHGFRAIESWHRLNPDKSNKKLSEEIEACIQQVAVDICNDTTTKEKFRMALQASRQLRYSKKVDGATMLSRIDPSIVAQHCRRFFAPAYECLKAATDI